MNNEPLEREPMNNEPLEREPIDRVRARLEALLKANAAPRCGARSKRTGKPCQGAAMPNGRCKLHGGKSTGPRTPEGLERSRRANHSPSSTDWLRSPSIISRTDAHLPLQARALSRAEEGIWGRY
jgi:hypothetical protein